MSIYEKYKIETDLLKYKIIPRNKINEYLLLVLENILKDIKNKEKDELDIGDIYPIAIQNAETLCGYKLIKDVRDFFELLGSYKDDPFESGHTYEKHTIEHTEETKDKLLTKLRNKIKGSVN